MRNQSQNQQRNSDRDAAVTGRLRIISTFIFCFFITVFSSCSSPEKFPAITPGNDYKEYLYLKDRIEKNPRNMELYLYLGESDIMLGRLDGAEESFIKILQAYPPAHPSFISEAHRRLGLVYLDTGYYDKAQDEIRIISKTFPWQRSIYDLRGHYWYNMHNIYRSRLYMGEFANPTCASDFVGAGNIQQGMENFEQAESIYKSGNIFDDEDPFLRACLGNLLASQERYDEAEKLLVKAIYTDPELGELYVYMGDIKQKKGRLREAVDWYRKALQIDRRSDEFARASLGEVYLKLAEKERRMSNPVIILVTFLTLLIPFLLFFPIVAGKNRNSPENRRKALIRTLVLFVVLLLILETASLLLLNGDNPLSERLNPATFYYHKAVDSLDKAVRINPNRKDLRVNLAAALRGAGRNRAAAAEQSIADGLPGYYMHDRLRFTYP